jgi:cation diffusion facilitator family transporter
MEQNSQRLAMQVSIRTILLNLLLSAIKLLTGIIGHSAAMVSDAVHSLSDVASTIVVLFGLKAANQKADKEHPYGHERFECVAAILLAGMLGITGGGIALSSLRTILAGQYAALTIPSLLPLGAAVISIGVKIGMYQYTKMVAQKINSTALLASALDHRSDVLSSVGSLLGIAGARMGFAVVDPAAGLIISLFIVKTALHIFMDAINKMTDRACDDKTVEEIRALVLAQEKVLGIDLLRTRLFGDRIYVDVEISVDGNVSLYDSHDIAHTVHDALEDHFPNIKHCMVHVNPKISPQAQESVQ